MNISEKTSKISTAWKGSVVFNLPPKKFLIQAKNFWKLDIELLP